MRKIIKALTSKSLILGLLLLAQLVFIFIVLYLLLHESVYGVYIHLFFQVIGFLIVIHIIANDDNPTYKMAWLIPVLAVPVFGSFFYIFYHSNNVSKSAIKKYDLIIANRYDLLKEHPSYSNTKEVNYFNFNGWRDYKNTTSTFFNSGMEKFESLLVDLKKAEKFIFLEYFILAEGYMFDEIMKVLVERAQAGVIVKIIFDDMGSADRLPFNFVGKMKKENIEVVRFNRMRLHINFAMNYRDHRKIVVIDNKIAYTGGVNIGDEYINRVKKYGHWSDTALKIEGEAVWSLTLLFLENWNYTSKNKLNFDDFYYQHIVEDEGYYVPFGDNPLENEQVARNTYLYLIGQAKKEVLITTPYLIMDNELITALKLAVQSGVSVKIVIPKIADKKLVYLVTKSYAYELHKLGVKIYQYTPGFIHSKLLVVDNEKALVGTTNLDFRSLYLHFETNIYMHNTNSINDVKNYIDNTILESNLCRDNDLYQKGVLRNILITVLKGFGPIL